LNLGQLSRVMRIHPLCDDAMPGPVGLYSRPLGAREPGRARSGASPFERPQGQGRDPRWIEVPLLVETAHGGRPEPVGGAIRIEKGPGQGEVRQDGREGRREGGKDGGPDIGRDGDDRRVVVANPEQAREIASQLIRHSESAERLIALRGGERTALEAWAARALAAGELIILVRKAPDGAPVGAKDLSQAPTTSGTRPRSSGAPPPPVKNTKEEPHWVEIEVTSQDGKPLPEVAYLIVTADKQKHSGTTDKRGRARLDGIVGGVCQVSLTELDDVEWKKA
jgi:hypothetical protein